MIVDTHTHVVSPDLHRYPLRPAEEVAEWVREAPCSAAQLDDLMGESGVDRAVLVQAVGAYADDNRYALDAAELARDRYVAVAMIDAGNPEAAEQLEAVAARDAAGVRLVAGTPGSSVALDDGVVLELARRARELGMAVVVATLAEGLPALLRLMEQAPDLELAVDHCGFPPYPDLGALLPLAAFPGLLLKVSTLNLDAGHAVDGDGGAALLGVLADAFGAERLMWGSNWSYTHDRPYPEIVEVARAASKGLGAHAQAQYLGGTALRHVPGLKA
ncbi:MAG: amidohydrolase [Actinomycetia bacterium]|nr:amidohydrolase [Actinomycetes bacterium]